MPPKSEKPISQDLAEAIRILLTKRPRTLPELVKDISTKRITPEEIRRTLIQMARPDYTTKNYVLYSVNTPTGTEIQPYLKEQRISMDELMRAFPNRVWSPGAFQWYLSRVARTEWDGEWVPYNELWFPLVKEHAEAKQTAGLKEVVGGMTDGAEEKTDGAGEKMDGAGEKTDDAGEKTDNAEEEVNGAEKKNEKSNNALVANVKQNADAEVGENADTLEDDKEQVEEQDDKGEDEGTDADSELSDTDAAPITSNLSNEPHPTASTQAIRDTDHASAQSNQRKYSMSGDAHSDQASDDFETSKSPESSAKRKRLDDDIDGNAAVNIDYLDLQSTLLSSRRVARKMRRMSV